MPGRLGDTQFLDLLCNSLADDETTAAIAEALDSPLLQATLILPDLLLYARLALAKPESLAPALARLADQAGGLKKIPEPLLDLLAWQFHVDGYEAALSYEAKRRLVDTSILLHRRKGTPWAVINALKSAFETWADVSEWFDYGGKPYFFRVGIDVTNIGWNESTFKSAYRLIYEYKNVRSWLESFVTRWKQQALHQAGAAVTGHVAAKSQPYFPAPAPVPAAHVVFAFLRSLTHAKPQAWYVAEPPAPAAKRFGALISGAITSQLKIWQKREPFRPIQNYYGAAFFGLTKSAIRFYWGKPEAGRCICAAQYGYLTTKIKFYGGQSG